MIDKEKYSFKPYTEKYKYYFKQEKYNLERVLKINCPIEHIGSTAIPGLGGKGIVDVMLVAPKTKTGLLDTRLRKNKYDFREASGNSGRLFYQRDYKYKNGVRRVHLHLMDEENQNWRDNIAFRDYLRNNPEDSAEYGRIKREGAKLCAGDKGIYKQYKHAFIQKILKKINHEI